MPREVTTGKKAPHLVIISLLMSIEITLLLRCNQIATMEITQLCSILQIGIITFMERLITLQIQVVASLLCNRKSLPSFLCLVYWIYRLPLQLLNKHPRSLKYCHIKEQVIFLRNHSARKWYILCDVADLIYYQRTMLYIKICLVM